MLGILGHVGALCCLQPFSPISLVKRPVSEDFKPVVSKGLVSETLHLGFFAFAQANIGRKVPKLMQAISSEGLYVCVCGGGTRRRGSRYESVYLVTSF